MSYLVVLTTVPNRKDALSLSEKILRQRLAACVQISGPVQSLYRWKGKNEKSRELQLWIKTKASAYKKLENFIRKNHAYEVPEIIALPVKNGSRDYLSWIGAEVLS